MKKLFYETTSRLDFLKTQKTLSPADINGLLKCMEDIEYYRYFFYDLTNPVFVTNPILRRYFSRQLANVEGSRSFYIANYLKRIGRKESKNVTQIILRTKPVEPQIGRMIIEIILMLDINDAAKLERLCSKHLINSRLAEGELLSQLIVKYVEGKKHAEAIHLFTTVMRPVKKKIAISRMENSKNVPAYESVGRLEEYEYKSLLEVAFPKILERLPREVIFGLEKNLTIAIEVESSGSEKKKEDYSYIWRPAIEDHEQNYDFGRIRDILVSLLRNSLTFAANQRNRLYMRALLQRYLASKYTIFNRLALFELSEHVKPFLSVIKKIVTDKAKLDDHRIRHELYGLLKRSYSELSIHDQKKILTWIDNGPDADWWIKWRTNEEGVRPSDETIERYKNKWRLERYWILKEEIIVHDPKRKTIIADLEKSLGAPEHPDFLTWHEEGAYEIEPSVGIKDILTKSDDELIIVLTNPPQGKEAHPLFDDRGVGLSLVEAMKQQPDRFSRFAALLTTHRVKPVFVGFYFQGLSELWKSSANQTKPRWLSEQKSLMELVANAEPNPMDWSPTERSRMRLDLCRLLEYIVSVKDIQLSDEELAFYKRLLIAMVGDADPEIQEEAKLYSESHDWTFIAINHTSGEVVHTLVKYALCYVRNHKDDLNRLEVDVKQAFEEVLKSDKRPSVISAFGTSLTNLWYLDAAWTKSNLNHIFPTKDSMKFTAAWGAYLKFNTVYKDIYESLRIHYTAASKAYSQSDAKEEINSSRLAYHLSLAYLRGLENLTDKSSPVRWFFLKAPSEGRIKFIRQAGALLRQLHEAGQLTQKPEVWERAKALWKNRIGKIASHPDMPPQEDEVSALLAWLAFSPEDVKAMKTLIIRSLKKWNVRYHSGPVTEYLSRHSVVDPLTSVEVLKVLFARPLDTSTFYFDDNEVRQILESALAQGGKAARLAVDISNTLGQYGRFEFKDIWERRKVEIKSNPIRNT